MQVLIVDDEPIARDILQQYISKIEGLQLVAACSNALEALSIMNTHPVDLILLDIDMPEITGLEFIKTLKEQPLFIFTTAYPQYAVESYELNAIDYLLKPVSFNRFLTAINKAIFITKTTSSKPGNSTPVPDNEEQILFVKSDGKLVKVDLSQLWLIEGLKDYVCLWTGTHKTLVLSTMQNFEEQLAAYSFFIRVNRSFIINIRYIQEIEGNCIRINGRGITIGNTYKNEVGRAFQQLKLL